MKRIRHASPVKPAPERDNSGRTRQPPTAPNPLWQHVATTPPRLQAKLTIGAPNDPYEKEADRVADQVMRMPEPAVQRKCAKCEEEEKVQTKEEPGEVPALTQAAESRIQGLRGGGSPLPEPVRSYFEPRFGHDFSSVRIHTGAGAAETAQSIRARAYTVGTDIVFGGGQYAPSTPEGGRLLAHELTHVVQQGGGAAGIQREPAKGDQDARSYVDGVLWLMSTGIREYQSNDHIDHPERHPNTLRKDLEVIRRWFLDARNRVTKELNDDADLQKKLIDTYRLYVYTVIEGFERKLKQPSWKLYNEHKDVIDPLAGPPPAGKKKEEAVQLDGMDNAVLPKLKQARCGMINLEKEHCGNVLATPGGGFRLTGPVTGELNQCGENTTPRAGEKFVAFYHSHPRNRSIIPATADPNLTFTPFDTGEADRQKIIFYLVNWRNEVLKYYPGTRDVPGRTVTIAKFEDLDCGQAAAATTPTPPGVQAKLMPEPAVQRKCAECEEEEKVQTKEEPGGRLLAHVVQQGGAFEQVRRTEIQDCKEDQTEPIKTALADADKDLGDSIKELEKRPLTALAKGALWLAVRSESEDTANKMKEKLGKIKKGLAEGSVECEQPEDTAYSVGCPEARRAYTLGVGSIHLCMHLWPKLTKLEKATNLIHEGAHHFLNISDQGRMTESCKETYETVGLSSSDRFDNPDSYSCGVHYIKHGSNVTGQADAYKGKNLKVVQDPTGDIDLNAADEKSTMFRIEGAPDPSGFKYRWVIKDAQDQSYLMKVSVKDGDPFRYGDHMDTFIGAKTRALLKEKGIQKAEVHCRVKVPEVGEPLLKLPVTFTTAATTAGLVQRAPQDPAATAHYPNVDQQKELGTIFNPIGSGGSAPPAVVDAAGFETEMKDRLNPYIDKVAESARDRRDSGREVPRSGIDTIADVAEKAVLARYDTYLKSGGVAPASHLRDTLKLVPDTQTPETDEAVKDWVESRMDVRGGDIVTAHKVVGGNRGECGDSPPPAGWDAVCRDRTLFLQVRDALIAARQTDLRTIILFFPAFEKDGVSFIQPRIGSPAKSDSEKDHRRKSRWRMLGSLMHEMLHTVAHPDFRTAVGATQKQKVGVEGFAEYFARQVYGEMKIAAEDGKMPKAQRLEIEGEEGIFIDIPELKNYPEMIAEVEKVRDQTNEQSLRVAYFMGKTEYIGLKNWDAKTAEKQEAARHPANVLGFGLYGLYLDKESSFGVEARYARVVLGRGKGHQLQVGGSLSYILPESRIQTGADLIYEYRHPSVLYVRPRAGLQVGASTGEEAGQSFRLDAVPGFEIGARLGMVRIGADARLLIPLAKGDEAPGGVGFQGGVSLSFELGGKKTQEKRASP